MAFAQGFILSARALAGKQAANGQRARVSWVRRPFCSCWAATEWAYMVQQSRTKSQELLC